VVVVLVLVLVLWCYQSPTGCNETYCSKFPITATGSDDVVVVIVGGGVTLPGSVSIFFEISITERTTLKTYKSPEKRQTTRVQNVDFALSQ
jgi:hypothetical protein